MKSSWAKDFQYVAHEDFYKNINNIRREPLPPSPSLRPSPSAAVEAMVEVGGADPLVEPE